jgi:hypothetical protein
MNPINVVALMLIGSVWLVAACLYWLPGIVGLWSIPTTITAIIVWLSLVAQMGAKL